MIDAVFRLFIWLVVTFCVTKLIMLVVDALHYGLLH